MDPITALVVLGVAVVALAKCGTDKEDPSKPLDSPPDDLTEDPDPIRGRCLDPTRSYMIKVDAVGASAVSDGGPLRPMTGCGVWSVDRQNLSVNGNRFKATARPAIPGTSAKALARTSGQPLSHLNFSPADSDGGVSTQNWGVYWPEQSSVLSLIMVLEGTIDPDTCAMNVESIRGYIPASIDAGGAGDAGAVGNQVALSVYEGYSVDGGPKECLPNAAFSNERIVARAAIQGLNFSSVGEAVEVCSGNCADVKGNPNPESLKMTLIQQEL